MPVPERKQKRLKCLKFCTFTVVSVQVPDIMAIKGLH